MRNEMIWFRRKFSFALPPEHFPMIVERLRGTPARLEEKVRNLPPDLLTMHRPNSWTILEQIGHLGDVEALWIGRMDDFDNGIERLRPADTENRKTHGANHNEAPPGELLSRFRFLRQDYISRLDDLQPDRVTQTALHPRLDQPMRIIDLAYFAAEHDDHHLSRITDLIG